MTGAGDLAGASRASWGTRVAGRDGRGVATYLREFRDGGYTVTHVNWAA